MSSSAQQSQSGGNRAGDEPEQVAPSSEASGASVGKPDEDGARAAESPGSGEFQAAELSNAPAARRASRFPASWENAEPGSAGAPAGGTPAAWAPSAQHTGPGRAAGGTGSATPSARLPAPGGVPAEAHGIPRATPASIPPAVHEDDFAQLPVAKANKTLAYAGVGAVAVLIVIVLAVAFSGGDGADAAEASEQPASTSTQEGRAAARPEPGDDVPVAARGASKNAPHPQEETNPPPTVPQPPPTAEPRLATVQVTVRTSPRNAQLFLDDAPISNPYEARVDQGARHTFRATAEGYRQAETAVHLDRDRDVTIRLERTPAPPPATHASSPHPATRARAAATHRTRGSTMRTRAPMSSRPRHSTMRRTDMRRAGFVTTNPY